MRKDKAQAFRRKLMSWYRVHARQLPWRETTDPYKIWISEVMLQQTTVNAVIPYYNKWIKKYPTIDDIVNEREQNLLKTWQGLGYYTRVKNIKKAAHIIATDFDGKIPNDPELLKKIPGFGPYTVGAVLSIAYDQRAPIVDANIRRVFMRLSASKGYADSKQDKDILEILNVVMPTKNNNIFNQALMELGALVCRSKEPICSLCPVMKECKAYGKGIQEIIPEVKKRILKNIDVAIGVIERKGKYFIQRRPDKGLLAGLWEFPGGKFESGETAQQALKREVKEELGFEVAKSKHLMNVMHYYTSFRVRLHVYICELKIYPNAGSDQKWVTAKGLSRYPMPSGSAKIVEKIIN